MRKRSKYRPKPIRMDPIGYVLESITPVAKHDSYLVDLKLKNHAAMSKLVRGEADMHDMTTIIAVSNIVEALWQLGFGKEYEELLAPGQNAIKALAARASETGRYVCYASEITALNALMELHDAQMDVITVRDMERALKLAKSEQINGRATRLPKPKDTT